MKRLAAFLSPLLIILIFTACSVKEYTPSLPLTFTQNAQVSAGDFSYRCEICRKESSTAVTVTSTSAAGTVMEYDGESLTVTYGGYSMPIDKSGVQPSNAAAVVYEAVNCLFSDGSTAVRKIDGGFKYEGKISAGSFTLTVNDDGSLNRLCVPSLDFTVDFY